MRLEDALTQIQEIRGQLARATVYRGTRAVSLAATSVLAIVTALLQPVILGNPVSSASLFALYWLGSAFIALGIVGIQVLHTYRRTLSIQDRATTRAVLAAAGTPIAIGAAVSVVLTLRGLAPLLPGLWPIFVGISIFAARSSFPSMSGIVALLYTGAGIGVLAALDARTAMNPWVMGLTFSIGQAAAALVFYWNLEREPEVGA